jgi:hypothetical protein
MFEGFEGEGIKVKMCELGKKKNLVGSWEFLLHIKMGRVFKDKMKEA